jgi:uncharacterized membrane protein YccC
MKLASRTELLFSVKSFAAAMLAVYISMRIGLPRPFWAMMTAYIVSAPFAAPTRSKGMYRAGGTLLGAVVVTFLVPQLANSPELLSLALALWIGGCLYFSLLDRTPRSYLLMLAGYTAGLIAFPAVGEPGAIFDIALARVEEITLGITCATVIHSLVLPQPFGPVLLARLDHAVQDAHHWIRDALNPAGDTRSPGDRRKLAGDITELRVMSTHLPFDTSHVRWTGKAVNALQERLAQFVPVVSGIEDRLTALREMGAAESSSRWSTLLHDVTALVDTPKDTVLDAPAAALHARIDALAPQADRGLGWSGLVELNLAARLRRLVDLCVETRTLRQHIDAGMHGKLPDAVRRLPGVPPSALHQDRGMALLSAFAAVVATLACCAFWILTGWPSGAAAPMMAAVLCCFFSTQDDPVPFIKGFLVYTIYSIPVSALYILGILPAIHSFEMLALVCAPTFLLVGVLDRAAVDLRARHAMAVRPVRHAGPARHQHGRHRVVHQRHAGAGAGAGRRRGDDQRAAPRRRRLDRAPPAEGRLERAGAPRQRRTRDLDGRILGAHGRPRRPAGAPPGPGRITAEPAGRPAGGRCPARAAHRPEHDPAAGRAQPAGARRRRDQTADDATVAAFRAAPTRRP